MLVLRDVSKYYFGQSRVLDSLSLQLKRGDFLYVVGGTGAGKSSLLRILSTEESTTSGSVSLFGFDLAQTSPHTLRAIRRSIGVVPQNTQLIPDMTVAENIALSLSLAGRRALNAEARLSVDELIEKLGLSAKRDVLSRNLSGGEAQRVAVARALVRKPELLIADEPTGAQDRESTWAIMDLFLKMNLSGTTVVLATHDMEIVRRVRKRCVVLRGGRLHFEEATACTY